MRLRFTKNIASLEFLFFATVVAAKLALVISIGPLPGGDTPRYTGYASLILSSLATRNWAWLRHFPLDSRVSTLTERAGYVSTETPPGYPALLALSTTLSPSHPGHMVILLQSVATIVLFILLFISVMRLTGRRALAFVAVALAFMSWSLVFDLLLMTDSLFSSLLAISALTLLLSTERRTSSACILASLSLMLAASVRETGLYFSGLLGVAYGVVLTLKRRSVRTGLFQGLCIAAPTFCFCLLIGVINYLRSNEFFTYTATRWPLMYALVALDRRGVELFPAPDPASAVMRSSIHQFQKELTKEPSPYMGLADEIADTLYDKFGLNVADVNAMTKREFLRALVSHPVSFVVLAVTDAGPSIVSNLFSLVPVLNLANQSGLELRPEEVVDAGREVNAVRYYARKAFWLFVAIVQRIVSGTILLLLSAYGVILVVGRKSDGIVKLDIAVLLPFLVYCSGTALLALTMYLPRYAFGLTPLGLVVAAYSFHVGLQWRALATDSPPRPSRDSTLVGIHSCERAQP
jgi:hypothetical protein